MSFTKSAGCTLAPSRLLQVCAPIARHWPITRCAERWRLGLLQWHRWRQLRQHQQQRQSEQTGGRPSLCLRQWLTAHRQVALRRQRPQSCDLLMRLWSQRLDRQKHRRLDRKLTDWARASPAHSSTPGVAATALNVLSATCAQQAKRNGVRRRRERRCAKCVAWVSRSSFEQRLVMECGRRVCGAQQGIQIPVPFIVLRHADYAKSETRQPNSHRRVRRIA